VLEAIAAVIARLAWDAHRDRISIGTFLVADTWIIFLLPSRKVQ
jgi:hypothetical protein